MKLKGANFREEMIGGNCLLFPFEKNVRCPLESGLLSF